MQLRDCYGQDAFLTTGGIIWEVEGRGSGTVVLFFSKCFRDGFLPIKN